MKRTCTRGYLLIAPSWQGVSDRAPGKGPVHGGGKGSQKRPCKREDRRCRGRLSDKAAAEVVTRMSAGGQRSDEASFHLPFTVSYITAWMVPGLLFASAACPVSCRCQSAYAYPILHVVTCLQPTVSAPCEGGDPGQGRFPAIW